MSVVDTLPLEQVSAEREVETRAAGSFTESFDVGGLHQRCPVDAPTDCQPLDLCIEPSPAPHSAQTHPSSSSPLLASRPTELSGNEVKE